VLLLGWCSSFLNQGHKCGLGNQERKKSMSKNTNRKGLALGAMFSLVATMFGALPASANAATNAFTFAPVSGSSYTVFVDHDFHMMVQRNASVVTSTDFAAQLKYEITTDQVHSSSSFSMGVIAGTWNGTVSGIALTHEVSRSANTAVTGQFAASQRIYNGGVALAQTETNRFTTLPQLVAATPKLTQSFVVDPASRSGTLTNFIGLKLLQHGAGLYPNSSSATVVATVRAFLDLNGDNVYQSASEPSGTQTVTFARYSAVAPTVTVAPYSAGDTTARATVTLAASSLNLNQTDGKWGVRFQQHINTGKVAAVSYSSAIERTLTFAEGAGLSFTESVTVTAAQAAYSISAEAVFFRDNGVFGEGAAALAFTTGGVENALVAASQSQVIMWHGGNSVTAAASGASAFSVFAVNGDNVLGTTHAAAKYDVRLDSTVTVRVTASGVLSASAVTATFTFSNPAMSATKFYSVNGGTAVTSGTQSAVTATVNAVTGVAEITVRTTGFAAGDALSISARVSGLGGQAQEITLYTVGLTYALTADATDLAIAPGGTVNVGATAKDQFGVNSSAINQRIKFSWTQGYGGTATVSDVVTTRGYASAAMVHSPATSTVSARISAQLQEQTAGVWANSGTAVTINVTPTTAANGFRTGLARSYSATISYGAAFSWSPVINDAYVIVTGSSIVVSGTGLIFKDDVLGLTASDRITLPGDSAARVKFYVTARKAGTYTLTLTAGTATTTSLIVVSDAQDNAGSAINFDISSMESGRAAIVTGTVTDLNGNPVDTTLGNASIAISVAGTGATYVGSLTAETNANGQFQVPLLSGTNQTGTMTITAVYSPVSNAAASVKVTKVHTVSVVAPTAPEVNAVIGSFSGRWAVRVENAKGSVVSVKAGNRWVKFSALNNNYLFSRKSVVGRTIAVSVWVDGELQNSQTITIK